MTLSNRIDLLAQLGAEILSRPTWLVENVEQAFYQNRWFTPESSWQALNAIATNFLDKDILVQWVQAYEVPETIEHPKKVGLVLAGNIPLVGFHDVLCCFVAGHITLAKMSSKDSLLLTALIDWMTKHEPEVKDCIHILEKLAGFDAVIATGSNNSSTYFHQYFSKYPHIIRKNRSAVAVLTGDESEAELIALGHDIFNYYGLGCRNVSKLYVPEKYAFDRLLTVLHDNYKEIINHSKYKNNFDYNYALFMLNKVEFLMSGSLIITESEEISSRIATLHYQRYSDIKAVNLALRTAQQEIQCVVTHADLPDMDVLDYGQAQSPRINDYADGVDTMAFLMELV